MIEDNTPGMSWDFTFVAAQHGAHPCTAATNASSPRHGGPHGRSHVPGSQSYRNRESCPRIKRLRTSAHLGAAAAAAAAAAADAADARGPIVDRNSWDRIS